MLRRRLCHGVLGQAPAPCARVLPWCSHAAADPGDPRRTSASTTNQQNTNVVHVASPLTRPHRTIAHPPGEPQGHMRHSKCIEFTSMHRPGLRDGRGSSRSARCGSAQTENIAALVGAVHSAQHAATAFVASGHLCPTPHPTPERHETVVRPPAYPSSVDHRRLLVGCLVRLEHTRGDVVFHRLRVLIAW